MMDLAVAEAPVPTAEASSQLVVGVAGEHRSTPCSRASLSNKTFFWSRQRGPPHLGRRPNDRVTGMDDDFVDPSGQISTVNFAKRNRGENACSGSVPFRYDNPLPQIVLRRGADEEPMSTTDRTTPAPCERPEKNGAGSHTSRLPSQPVVGQYNERSPGCGGHGLVHEVKFQLHRLTAASRSHDAKTTENQFIAPRCPCLGITLPAVAATTADTGGWQTRPAVDRVWCRTGCGYSWPSFQAPRRFEGRIPGCARAIRSGSTDQPSLPAGRSRTRAGTPSAWPAPRPASVATVVRRGFGSCRS